MYLNYITVVTKEKWYDDVTSEFKFETELEQHLLINQVDPKTQERVSSTDKMRNYGLQFQDYPYNKEFWDDYNVIKDTPIDKKILADLERVAPLEKQFENNYRNISRKVRKDEKYKGRKIIFATFAISFADFA